MRFIYKYPQTHKNYPGIKPINLGVPWYESYLQHQQKEQSSVRFIYIYTTAHQKLFREALDPLGPTLIYNTKKGTVLYEVYILIYSNQLEEMP